VARPQPSRMSHRRRHCLHLVALLTLAAGGVAGIAPRPLGAVARAAGIAPARLSAVVPTTAARRGRHPPPPPASPAVLAAAVNAGNDHQYLFWRGADGDIHESWNTDRWHGPVNTHWSSASAPTAGVTLAGHQYVFWQNADGGLEEAWYNHGWHGPRDLTTALGWGAGTLLASAPSVAVNPANDRQYVFWRGANGHLYEAWNLGRWHPPVDTHWSSASAPSAAVTQADHQYVFWQSAKGDLEEASYVGGWHGPQNLTQAYHWGSGGRPASAPAAAVNPGNDSQYVFWRAVDGEVHEAWNTGRWHRPVDSHWRSASAPSVAATLGAHQYVFWQATDDDLYEASYLGSWLAAVDRGWRVGTLPTGWPNVSVTETTADLTRRLTPQPAVQFGAPPRRGTETILVRDRIQYQRVTGVGGAMTDTAAWLIYQQLAPAVRAGVLEDLFGRGAAHLGFTLVPMAGSDFTAGGLPYTYDDVAAGQSDPGLGGFSIAHDQGYILPALRQMLAINPDAEVFAAPWTAPPWMKANDAFDDVGLKGSLLPSAYGAFASYFVKFLQAYAAAGVRVAAVAPENEPASSAAFPAMYFPVPNEAQWIAQYLQPALHAAGLSTQIYGADVAWRNYLYQHQLATGAARPVLSGLAWHCYSGIPNVMTALHAQAPALDQIVTECAKELHPFPVPLIAIGALRNWASAVTLWNLALDPAGGPVQAPNSGCHGCTGLVTVDERSHTVAFGLGYYQLAQLGRYVQDGARRIDSNHFVRYRETATPTATPGLDDVAFENPDGTRVVVAYNNGTAPATFAVQWNGRSFSYTLPANAIATFSWHPPGG
jgi:O-glycosyl hydrolase